MITSTSFSYPVTLNLVSYNLWNILRDLSCLLWVTFLLHINTPLCAHIYLPCIVIEFISPIQALRLVSCPQHMWSFLSCFPFLTCCYLVIYWFPKSSWKRCGNTVLFGWYFEIGSGGVSPQIVTYDSYPYRHLFTYNNDLGDYGTICIRKLLHLHSVAFMNI